MASVIIIEGMFELAGLWVRAIYGKNKLLRVPVKKRLLLCKVEVRGRQKFPAYLLATVHNISDQIVTICDTMHKFGKPLLSHLHISLLGCSS